MPTPPKWQGIRFQQTYGNLLDLSVDGVMGPTVAFLESVADFLGVLKNLLFDFGNPLAAIIDGLIQEIIDLLNGLRQIGVFFLNLLPNFQTDPEYLQIKGGYEAFIRRINTSLSDTEDPNRPQFGPTHLMGGIVLALNTSRIGDLIKITNQITGFLGRAWAAQPAAPINLTAVPADTEGNAIPLSPTLGTFEVGGALLEWSTPGILTAFTFPDFFLIERSNLKQGDLQFFEVPLDTFANLSQPDLQKETVFVKRFGVQHSEWDVVATVAPDVAAFSQDAIPTQDQFGLLHFPEDAEGVVQTPAALLSLLNPQSEDNFTFFDPSAEKGETYYYRVRSFYGDETELAFTAAVADKIVSGPTTSEPSTPASVSIPNTPEQFPIDPDTVTPENPTGEQTSLHKAMLVLYRAAYALQFYRLETEFPGDIPTGTESVPEIDARSLFDWLNFIEGVFAVVVAEQSAQDISDHIGIFSNRAANRILLRPQAADLFASVYATQEADLRLLWELFELDLTSVEVAAVIQDPPPLGVEINRVNVLQLINLVRDLGLFDGTPPNWQTIRLLEDIFPLAEEALSTSVSWLQGLLKGAQGIVNDVGEYIEFLERKIAFLLDFIETIETTLQFMVTADFGGYLLHIPPAVGGTQYFTNALLTAEPAEATSILDEIREVFTEPSPPGTVSVPPGPGGGSNDYTSGFVLAYGTVGDPEFEKRFEATKAAFELLFGTP